MKTAGYFLCICLAFMQANKAFSDDNGNSLRFVVMGDWGGLPFFPYRTAIETAVAKQMGDYSRDHNVEFILALGDNFYFDGVADIDDPRFQETYNHVYVAAALNVDWYFVAGNHDHNGNVSAQIAYSKLVNRWKYPDFWYKLQFNLPDNKTTVDIVMIDTVLLCGNSDTDQLGLQPPGPEDKPRANEQIQWIEQQIRESTAEYLIIAGHYPVYSIAEHGPTKCLLDMVEPMLHKYSATAYFCGHDHNLQHLTYADKTYNTTVDYFVSGAANFIDPSVAHKDSVPPGSSRFHWADVQAFGGFAYVDVTPSNMTYTFMEANGKKLYEKVMFPRKV